MKLFKKVINKIYNIKYCRIRKPKKDEMLIFGFEDATQEDIALFEESINEMLKSNKKNFLITNGKFKITKCKKKQVKKWILEK